MRSNSKRALNSKQKLQLFWLLCICSFLLDRFSKHWAVAKLSSGEIVSLLGDFLGLQLVYNSGISFSLFDITSSSLFTALFISMIVLWGFIFLSDLLSKFQFLGLALIFGGALGNLFDRFFTFSATNQLATDSDALYHFIGGEGKVIDFIRYSNWFIGNLADVFIFVGVVVILIKFISCKKTKKTSSLHPNM